MRLVPCSCLLALVTLAPQEARDAGSAPAALRELQQIELEVVHWEGSFGSYLSPAAGYVLFVDLDAVGSKKVLGWPFGVQGERRAHFELGFLAPVLDEIEGGSDRGWTRRVLLSGRRRPQAPERTLMELVIQWEIERYKERDGRRVRLSSNITHVDLRLHTLRDDGTIREYGRARVSTPRAD